MSKYDVFLKAVAHTLEFEGGYVNDPVDPSGETKYGISKRSFPSLDIKNLTKERAIKIYEIDYWNGSIGYMLHDEALAMKVFDLGVHMGRTGVKRLLKKVIEYKDEPDVELLPTNAVEMLTDAEFAELLNDLGEVRALKTIRKVATEYYENIVKEDPKMKKYLKGWLRRVNS